MTTILDYSVKNSLETAIFKSTAKTDINAIEDVNLMNTCLSCIPKMNIKIEADKRKRVINIFLIFGCLIVLITLCS